MTEASALQAVTTVDTLIAEHREFWGDDKEIVDLQTERLELLKELAGLAYSLHGGEEQPLEVTGTADIPYVEIAALSNRDKEIQEKLYRLAHSWDLLPRLESPVFLNKSNVKRNRIKRLDEKTSEKIPRIEELFEKLKRKETAMLETYSLKALDRHQAALCLSGGGIRSAA